MNIQNHSLPRTVARELDSRECIEHARDNRAHLSVCARYSLPARSRPQIPDPFSLGMRIRPLCTACISQATSQGLELAARENDYASTQIHESENILSRDTLGAYPKTNQPSAHSERAIDVPKLLRSRKGSYLFGRNFFWRGWRPHRVQPLTTALKGGVPTG